MFRSLCAGCEQLAIERAKTISDDDGVMFVGCSHYQVGATCFVENGQIIDWSCWPVWDEVSFQVRAAAIALSYAQLNQDKALPDQMTTYDNLH